MFDMSRASSGSTRAESLRWVATLSAIALALILSVPSTADLLGQSQGLVPAGPNDLSGRADEAYAQLPIAFEPNLGQTDPNVSFLARGNRYGLFLTPGRAVLRLLHSPTTPASGVAAAAAELRMTFVGSSSQSRIGAAEPLPGKVHYVVGNDPADWLTNVPLYGTVRYEQVYPGIDLLFRGDQGRLEYDFVVAPGADLRQIVLGFPGADGIEIDPRGNLVVEVAGGVIRQLRPLIYQDVNGLRKEVPGGFRLTDDRQIAFRVGPYDATHPLVIDPVILYSTFLGGTSTDAGLGVAADGAGNAYVTGLTASVDFPTTPGAFQDARPGGRDAFVTKLNPSGSALVYSTYVGGSGDEWGSGIALDGSNNAYVTGRTESTNFPTTAGAFDRTFGGGVDAFVLKLNAAGNGLVYSTYLGGSGFEHDRDNIFLVRAAAIDVDGAGNAYVTGQTTSPNFPTANAIQPTHGGGACPGANLVCSDVYVTKLNAAGTGLVYSTFLGGGDEDTGRSIFVDASGSAYLAGTAFPGFPTTPGAFRTTSQGFEGFVSKVNAAGSALVFSSFLGGELSDEALGVAADASGNTFVTGSTTSFQFPTTPGAFQTSKIGNEPDAFVTKLNATGSALIYSTYIGERETDEGVGIAVDSAGNAHIAGHSQLGFPVLPCPSANFDVFVASLNAAGSALTSSACFGGRREDQAFGMALDPSRNIYVTGETASSGAFNTRPFPVTPGAFQTTFAGGAADAFVVKVGESSTSSGADLALTKTDAPDPVTAGSTLTYTLTVTNGGPDPASSVVLTDTLPSGVTFVSVSSTQGTCTGTTTISCNLGTLSNGAAVTVTISVTPTAPGTISNSSSVSSASADPDPSDNSATATTTVSSGSGSSCTITGTEGDDTLTGTAGPDVICGLGGEDVINGLAGNDTLLGGTGADRLAGGAGDDTLNGEAGADAAVYENAPSAVTVDLGAGSATGGDGADTLMSVEWVIGSRFADTIAGNGAANTVSGGAGNDTVTGQDGNDRLVGSDGNDSLDGGAGTDVLNGGTGVDVCLNGETVSNCE